MAAQDGLFSPSLVCPDVAAALPDGYALRPLRRTDYATGFLDCLRVLTTVGDVSEADFAAQFDRMARQGGYYVVVIEDRHEAVVATGALIVERKLCVGIPPPSSSPCRRRCLTQARGSIHNLGSVGHIEDIAVAKDQQGKKLGLRLIQALDFVAEQIGCYKSILDCSDANEGFYVKCGFRRAGLQMDYYYKDGKSKSQ